jgi:hypothetical protein
MDTKIRLWKKNTNIFNYCYKLCKKMRKWIEAEMKTTFSFGKTSYHLKR